MRRLVVGVVVIAAALVLLGGQPWPTWQGAAERIWQAVAPQPKCQLLLRDGTTVTLDPATAARTTTAAITAAEPATASGLRPQDLAMDAPQGVTCTVQRPDGPRQQPGELGLTPRAQALHTEVLALFGAVPYGGFAPQGVSSGHGARSAHYEGRAIDYFFRPVGDQAQRARGWQVANWLVANASRLEVAVIIFDDRIWSTRRSAEGWRPYSNPDGGTDPISRHLDHVHVDVIEGS
jgi:hypothetical protein